MTFRAAAVLLASGAGTRVGAEKNKVLLPLAGVPVLVHSLRTVAALPVVRRVVVTARADDRAEVLALVDRHLPGASVVPGGVTRHESEANALAVLAAEVGDLDVIAIHDAARPLAGPHLWARVLDEAWSRGGALPVTAEGPVLHRQGPRSRLRQDLMAVQTPQAFGAADLVSAYARAAADGFEATDTAQTVARYFPDTAIVGVPSSPRNLKVTWAEDFALAEAWLAGPAS